MLKIVDFLLLVFICVASAHPPSGKQTLKDLRDEEIDLFIDLLNVRQKAGKNDKEQQLSAVPNTETTEAAKPIEGDIFNTKICGTLLPEIPKRILGGTDARIGYWPWIGSLQVEATEEHYCGASLLNNGWAITAAHCFDNDEDPDTITFGFTSLQNPGPHAQSSKFTPFHYNKYDPASSNSEYDITLLKLKKTIKFTKYVRPICLSTLLEETQRYSDCQAAGWGALVEPESRSPDFYSSSSLSSSDYLSLYANSDYPSWDANSDYPDVLQELALPLISSADCKLLDQDVTENIICAGATPQGGMDTCQGDSGGPLMCRNKQDESWHLVGVVSTGSGCGRPNTPAFYTRITKFMEWIQKTVQGNS